MESVCQYCNKPWSPCVNIVSPKQLLCHSRAHRATVVLMPHVSSRSFYQPYYDILPESFDNFPIFWNKEKMAWLQGSTLVEEIRERRKNMRNDYQTVSY